MCLHSAETTVKTNISLSFAYCKQPVIFSDLSELSVFSSGRPIELFTNSPQRKNGNPNFFLGVLFGTPKHFATMFNLTFTYIIKITFTNIIKNSIPKNIFLILTDICLSWKPRTGEV